MDKIDIIVVLGPTASGKSALATLIAEEFSGEIISADSMQVYRHMDIGTAKPSQEELAAIPHHMIDVADPGESFDVARYRVEAERAIEEVASRGALPVVCGGTGLYIRALTCGLFDGPGKDEAFRKKLQERAKNEGSETLHAELKAVDRISAERFHPNNTVRIIRALEVYHLTGRPISSFHEEHDFKETPYRTLKIGLDLPRQVLYARINERTEHMLEAGLVRELEKLFSLGYSPDLKPMQGLGYKEISAFVRGRATLEEATEELKKNTRNYAKRQLTWFRRDPEINWVKPSESEATLKMIKEFLS